MSAIMLGAVHARLIWTGLHGVAVNAGTMKGLSNISTLRSPGVSNALLTLLPKAKMKVSPDSASSSRVMGMPTVWTLVPGGACSRS